MLLKPPLPRLPRPGGSSSAPETTGLAAATGLLVAAAVAVLAIATLTAPGTVHTLVSRVPDGAAVWLLPAGLVSCAIVSAAASRAAGRLLRRGSFSSHAVVLAAVLATLVSASGMWEFYARYIPTTPLWQRPVLFAFLEVAAMVEALQARDKISKALAKGEDRKKAAAAARTDRIGMWVVTAASAVLASMAASSGPELLFRLLAPLGVAWLWERAMSGLLDELPVVKEEVAWRWSLREILVRTGFADPQGRTVREAATDRRLTALALAAAKVAAVQAADGTGKAWEAAVRRRETALRRAVRHTPLASRTDLKDALNEKIIMLGSGAALTSLAMSASSQGPVPSAPGGAGNGHRELAESVADALYREDAGETCRLLGAVPDLGAFAYDTARTRLLGAEDVLAATALYADTTRSGGPGNALSWLTEATGVNQARLPGHHTIRDIRAVIAPAWDSPAQPDSEKVLAGSSA